ncbi:MAG: GNAT family N-acetyltransferase [Caldilineaceae bacterium SB0675_bin_29]|uniref:GNAT family N-acetyltransferase n=1 Tax=Caldilineaceae bacterium SB0675_bin_29 TaxID=2605266 RepID=A0A6B1FYI0_9CHLR|nr:GNAT family N-acetyltransferase [Caldilineaceae bacterium SB0675_bin_29]
MVALTRSAAASRLRDPQQGIRPFDVGRDLRAVSRLITEAFAEELDEQGEAALRELRILGYMSGLVRILYRSTGEFRNVFNGFVWVENKRVVGNVTVQRAASGSGRWQIANVAVSPAWRGRGISRALMEHALDYIREMGGSWAVLQVRGENEIARGLYERLRFENMGGTSELYAPGAPKRVAFPVLSNLQAFSAADGNLLYDLATSRPNAEFQWWRAVRRDEFQVPLEKRIGELVNWLAGRQRIYRYAIRDYTSRFEGAIQVTARCWKGEHHIRLWLRPDAQEQYAQPLVLSALALLQEFPRWPLRATVSTQDEIAVQTLLDHGFFVRSTLYTMRLRM